MLTMPPFVSILFDIKFSHSIFAMPFALLGACMAASVGGPIDLSWSNLGGQLVIIALCMVFARTVAMLANRILDRKIDALNPRTAGRALPSGSATLKQAITSLVISSILFVAATAFFGFLWNNWLPTMLAIPVIGLLCAYPLLKRFTWMCHLYLGISLAISPIAATIAIDPSFLRSPSIWFLAGMVMCWVTGFDIIYALQDISSDRRENIKSLPASLGVRSAMLISKALHVCSIGCLLGVLAYDDRFGKLFLIAICMVAVLLFIEHITIRHWGTTKMAITFFTLNGIASCVLGVMGLIDLL